ncbi:hypothetical protein [Streptomyces sp. NBC_00286]|uniref:hypothetical protein n=1 Tax=Streptomyces sp. NBC_00286 TaxID=2975701 RepID=UPI002E2E65DC|nr:hypothetical protein [Streptomyces sp. NBC_00286]
MSLLIQRQPAVPSVPAVHAQTIAANVLKTWPTAIGLTIEYVAHHDHGPRGAVTFAVVRALEPWPSPVLIRCDGYGHIARGCEHPRPDGEPCWHPSAPHLSLRDHGLCPHHLPPLAVQEWVKHPELPLYGLVTSVDPDGTVVIDFASGELTFHAAQVPRVPPHIAEALGRGPLDGPVSLIDE